MARERQISNDVSLDGQRWDPSQAPRTDTCPRHRGTRASVDRWPFVPEETVGIPDRASLQPAPLIAWRKHPAIEGHPMGPRGPGERARCRGVYDSNRHSRYEPLFHHRDASDPAKRWIEPDTPANATRRFELFPAVVPADDSPEQPVSGFQSKGRSCPAIRTTNLHPDKLCLMEDAVG